MKTKTPSKLEKILNAGHLAVTSECGPPRGSDPEAITQKAELIKDHVDAINITDNQTSVVRLSSLASCIHLKLMGVEPILQMVVRDRNRIALQSDILGAASFDIHNILCLSGDHQQFGDSAQGQNVFDIDSMQLIHTVKTMRDDGKFMNGSDVDVAPKLFIGAASNPFAEPFDFRVYRLAKKISAGADFIQTQCIYNMGKFREFMKRAVDMGLHEKCYILAGVTPMKSVGMALYMSKQVPGMDVPQSLIKRLRGAGTGNATEEGIKFALEQIEEFKEMEGIAGVHLMAIEWEHKVPEISERAGMLPRPIV